MAKKRIMAGLVMLALAGGASGGERIVAVSVEEIRADPAVLEGPEYLSTGQPDEQILAMAGAAGYAAVIDLRPESEDRGYDEAAAVEALEMRYYRLPVAGAEDVTFENARRLDRILAGIDGPVLVHCASGNRVGALFALRAGMAGASDEEALEVGKTAGLTRLEAAVRERLAED